MATVDERLVLNRRFPQLLLAGRGVGHEAAELREYAAILSGLYAAIRSVSGCRVVVDTSKSPLFGLILSWLPDIDLRVAHLVRDARGTLYSARRRVGHPFSPATGLLLYDFWHAVTELWLRRRRWQSVSPGPCSFATAISARVVHRDKGATRPSQPSERATNASFTRLVSLPS